MTEAAAEPAPSWWPPYFDPAAQRPRFSMGSRVRVRRGAPVGHCRTPAYCRGAEGVVERVLGHFADPQELAYGRSGVPKLPLYRVRFALADLWPERAEGFAAVDTLDVEIYEPWLEPFFDYSGDVSAEAARVEALRRGRA